MGESLSGVNSITRLGRFKEGTTRPIKLNLSGKEFRDQIISRKRLLMKCEDYKDIFVSKDRSAGQKEKRREFVSEQKNKDRSTAQKEKRREFVSELKKRKTKKGKRKE